MLDALDLCLACKGCAVDCPVGVDMATYKAEFLHQHYRRRLRPRSHYALGWLPTWTALAGAVPGGTAACNAVLARPLSRRLAARLAGLTPHRALPALYPPAAARSAVGPAAGAAPGCGDPALLFLDTFTRAFRPGLAGAAATALRAVGVDPRPVDRWCCGLTWISTGQLRAGPPGTGAHGGRTGCGRSRGPDRRPGTRVRGGAAGRRTGPARHPAARRVAGRVITFAGMLGRALDGGWHPPPLPAAARLQVHCHEYAVFGEWPQPQVLARMGVTDVTAATTCCGMAGNFGMERNHYPVSLAVADLSLGPLLEPLHHGRDADRPLLADGFSCRFAGRADLAPQSRPRHLSGRARGRGTGGPPVTGHGQAPVLHPLNPESTADRIAGQVRRRIIEGALAPGSRLGEAGLAAQLRVSRGPVREALARLVQEGLAVAVRNRGVFVVGLGPEDVADVYRARRAVEREAVSALHRSRDPAARGDALEELRGVVAAMAGAAHDGERDRLAELDIRFHEGLVSATGSPRLVRMFATLAAETRLCLAAVPDAYPLAGATVTEHEELLRLIGLDRPGRVLAALDQHFESALAALIPGR